MKKTYKTILYFLILVMSVVMSSCVDYLEKIEEADVTEKDVFGNYMDFQGFVEVMYGDIIDITHAPANGPEWNFGDDVYQLLPNYGLMDGNYWAAMPGRHAFYRNDVWRGYRYSDAAENQAYWQNGWAGIRDANIALSHIDDLVNPTPEEVALLKGQCYFFRGYLHWEIMRVWGNIPYSDTLMSATSDMRIPQLANFHATAEKVIADLEKAVELLPVDWDDTEVGQRTGGDNIGRINKGAALGILSEVLLYCGSPLMNGVSTGSYTYNTDYLKRCAEVAWDLIKLADEGVYGLEPWATLPEVFRTMNRTFPNYKKETIFAALPRYDARWFTQTYKFSALGGGAWFTSPTHNYTEFFEMSNGLPIDDPASGYDETDPWNNRDPRFRFNYILDGDRIVESVSDERAFAQLYVGGKQRNTNNSMTGYGWKKFDHIRANNIDNGWGSSYHTQCPRIRLAEVYLIYAEAVNEVYGPNGTHPGATLTAIDAINVVRNRANMPDVNAKFTTDTETFRERIRNERAVELAFEAKRWYDIRRWYVAHLPKYKELYGLEFDKDHTYFKKVLLYTRTFDLKHYWFPFPTDQVTLYPGWSQNPGW